MALLASAEAAINKALRYDPATQQKIARQTGKVLCLQIEQPSLTFYVRMGEQIQLMSHCESDISATLRGPAQGFLRLASTEDKQQALMHSDIEIQGSSQFALSLADASSALDIDWAAMLEDFTGPLVAGFIHRQVTGLFSFAKQAMQKLHDDSVSYLRDEKGLLIHKLEAQQHFRNVHELRLATDRLEARIQQLQKRLK